MEEGKAYVNVWVWEKQQGRYLSGDECKQFFMVLYYIHSYALSDSALSFLSRSFISSTSNQHKRLSEK